MKAKPLLVLILLLSAFASPAFGQASAGSFTNPLITSRDSADPWIVHHRGHYYFTATLDPDGGIWLWRSNTLAGLDSGLKVKVHTPDDKGRSKQIWAPELHHLNNRWYIYYTASDGVDENHRLYVLESRGRDPLGPYSFKARVYDPAHDGWAIDPTVFQSPGGRLYLLWVAHVPGNGNGIRIAPLSNPWTVAGPSALIAQADYDWERVRYPINEGPVVLRRAGRVFLVYSASDTGTPDYALGMLTHAGGDLTDAKSWKKSPAPVFGRYTGAEGAVYGPGHNGFFKSPDGREDWLIYHGKETGEYTYRGRSARAQRFGWRADGTPEFGRPFPRGLPLPAPSGEREPGARSRPAPSARAVRPGIETFLADVPRALRGKRVGLITNHTGIDRSRNSDIDLIAKHKDLKLVALLAPEHGIRGTAEAGERVSDETDPRTGVPVYSLYTSEDRGPTPEMLKDVDVLVYDLQEVGGRTWTYVSTMALSMQAAKRKGIPFVVLDRPNPIGGEVVEGALLDPRFKSFVGMYPIPARHGMTVGELATLFNRKYGIGADLFVARVKNWRRSQWFDETGLPWVNPSPNLRSLAALTSYPGSVYFEGTSLTEGRGTDRPFEQIGAPWLDAREVARVMNEKGLPGVRFEAITMSVAPTAAKHKGQTIPAIRFAVTDRRAYRPVRTSLLLIDEIRRRHSRDFAWTATIDRLTGSDKVRLAVEGGRLQQLLEEWDREAAEFRESRKPYLLYR